jgi:hypothetical protein
VFLRDAGEGPCDGAGAAETRPNAANRTPLSPRNGPLIERQLQSTRYAYRGGSRPSSTAMRLRVVVPVFNDWESFDILLRNLDSLAENLPYLVHLTAIDDLRRAQMRYLHRTRRFSFEVVWESPGFYQCGTREGDLRLGSASRSRTTTAMRIICGENLFAFKYSKYREGTRCTLCLAARSLHCFVSSSGRDGTQ